ncbi:MAG: hypothetical protein WC285_05590 [Candidatus Gracilibacteria bacterium]|jgi:hypothetical protein
MANKKTDWGYVIRTAFCVLALLATITYFIHECSVVANNYSMLVRPTSAPTISWFINFMASAVLFMMALGITVALVRPVWITIIAYAISALLYVFFIGSNFATWITAGVFLAILVLYLFAEVHLFQNQIKASTHPLGEKKMLVCSLLAILLSVAIGVGYAKDATQRNFVIPPEAETALSQYLTNMAKTQLEAQKLPEKQMQEALKKAEESTKTMVEKQKETMQPTKQYIPVLIGFLVFFISQIILIFAGIISMFLVPLLFWILSITHFTHTVTEKCEVTHLTVKSTN